MTQKPDGPSDILVRLRLLIANGGTDSITRELTEHAILEIEQLRDENALLREREDYWTEQADYWTERAASIVAAEGGVA